MIIPCLLLINFCSGMDKRGTAYLYKVDKDFALFLKHQLLQIG